MTFRVQICRDAAGTIFVISGDLDAEGSGELHKLMTERAEGRDVILDLSEVGLVDRTAMRCLVELKMRGAKLYNCPAYIRDWIAQEIGNLNSNNGGKKA